MRKVFKLNQESNDFEEVEMREIKVGEWFKMYNPDGTIVSDDKGETVFKAISDAYHYEGKVYQVDVE